MFFLKQNENERQQYENYLSLIWALSNLFSDSDTPYLYYRVAEKIFCRSFNAEDLSRWDVSADAKKLQLWIWLKTFWIWNEKTFQKVAEFNSDRPLYINLEPLKLIEKISELRNARIEFTQNLHSLNSSIYHCVIREGGKFKIYEENMDKINIQNIHWLKINNSSIVFFDWIHEYSFLLSKSTLTKRFITKNILHEFDVKILDDPLSKLWFLLEQNNKTYNNRIKDTIYLPLYWKNHEVWTKSWLNQWNAGGRLRNSNEVYIPVPADIHNNYPNFFPSKDVSFNLKLPDWDIMQSKLCQDWSKALMSYSNRELWKRILRDVLNLKEWELLTYDRLQIIGIDSVKIDKIDDLNFEINFSKIWSYERFKSKFQW